MAHRIQVLLLCLVCLLIASCSKPQPATESQGPSTSSQPANTAAQTAPKPERRAVQAKPIVIPAGTALTVRLDQAVGSKISHNGDSFSATVQDPVVVNGRTVIPADASAQGTVVEAAPLGRFKGGALLRLTLNSVTVNGKPHQVQTAAVS